MKDCNHQALSLDCWFYSRIPSHVSPERERDHACAGILDEKAAATQALGLYAKATLELYGPYVERTLPVLQRMAGYFHDDVREQAYDALSYLVAATAKAFPAPSPGMHTRFHACCMPHQ